MLSSPVAIDVEGPDVEQRAFSVTQGSAHTGPSEWWGEHALQGWFTGQGVALVPVKNSADLGSVRQDRTGCVRRV